MAHVPTIPLAPAFQRRLSLHSPTGFQTRTDACSLSSWNLAWNDSTNHCENNSLKRYGNQIRPIKQVTLLTSAFIAVQLGHPSTIYGPWRAEVEADNNDMEIKLRNPEHFYTKITCWWGMSLAHTLPRISSSSWPGRLRAMSALQTRIKGEKENHLNEKKALSLKRNNDHNHFSQKQCCPQLFETHSRSALWLQRSHLWEFTEDSVTLVRSNRDFWEIDWNGCVIQHLQLILNPRK